MLPRRQYISIAAGLAAFSLFLVFLRLGLTDRIRRQEPDLGDVKIKGTPKYKPTPTYTPPPVSDPFPLLSTATPPPIPQWNVARKDLHRDYGLPVAPPLLIGFTRTWPILLQAVVSYITAGWPADRIYVVENTGVQQANARGQLSLQNPFYLNHTQLAMLGVNVVQTPVLLSFAQLQNFFLSLSYAHDWQYYFWSHMDVMVLSYEDGNEHTPAYDQPGYKTVYELGCQALAEARRDDPRWAIRFFAYDHLALVNPAAYEDVGGWDTLIPYYLTDCDMHSRLAMANWTMEDRHAGIPTDTSSVLDDLLSLYREPGVVPDFRDPNPPPPEAKADQKDKEKTGQNKRTIKGRSVGAFDMANSPGQHADNQKRGDDYKPDDASLAYWRSLRDVANRMFHYKHGARGRNTWQQGQRGGEGEPFHYDAAGLAAGIEVATEAGREVYRQKWGHRDCDLISGAGLGISDQWKVEKDWK